jgi:hypothetical protein
MISVMMGFGALRDSNATEAWVAPVEPHNTQVSAPLRVMNIGESVVVGHPLIPGSYRLPLRQTYVDGGCPVVFVGHNTENSPVGTADLLRHDGERGWFIHEFGNVIVGWVSANKPDVVFIYAGIQDVRFMAGGAEDRLINLINQIMTYAPNAHIYVSNIKIVSPPTHVTAATKFNAALEPKVRALEASGKNVHWVSQADVLTPNDFVPNDPLHPNGFGSAKMADAWFNAARPHVCPNAVARQIGQSPPVSTATPTPTVTVIPTQTPTETPEPCYECPPTETPTPARTHTPTPTRNINPPTFTITPIAPSQGMWFTYLQFLQHDGSTPAP